MSLVYRGKTKDVYAQSDGNLEFHFKDDATGYMVDEKPVFNSGYDKVVGQIPGKGRFRASSPSISLSCLKKKASHRLREDGL